MTIFVFGNTDIEIDSLPLKILPQLKEKFPQIDFEIKDPNEEWLIPEELVIIDTVLGIENPTVFNSMKEFITSPRISLHDFDALSNLLYLEKLGKLKKIKIIGLPPTISEAEAVEEISKFINSIQP